MKNQTKMTIDWPVKQLILETFKIGYFKKIEVRLK